MVDSADSKSFSETFRSSGPYIPPHRRRTGGFGTVAPARFASAKLSDDTRLVYDVSLIVVGEPEDDPYALASATMQLALPGSSRATSVSDGHSRVRRWDTGPFEDESGPSGQVGRLLEKWNVGGSDRATVEETRVKAEFFESTAATARCVRFSGRRAQLVNWLGTFLRQENAHLFAPDAIPEELRSPRARAVAEHAPLFSSDLIRRSGCGIEQPDTYADNKGRLLHLLINESTLPLHPEERRGWIINLGRGPRHTFVKELSGDLSTSDAGVAAELILLAASAARCPIIAASAAVGAAVGGAGAMTVSAGRTPALSAGLKADPPVLGDTGPLLIVSHLGKWANCASLHAHLCLEPAIFLRGYFQTAGSLSGTGARAGLAGTDLFFIKTCVQRQLLEYNGAPYYVGLHEPIRKASQYVADDLRKCSVERLEAKGVIRLNLSAAAEAARRALHQAIEKGMMVAAVPVDAPAFRFLFSRDQARIAVWVARNSEELDRTGSAVGAPTTAHTPSEGLKTAAVSEAPPPAAYAEYPQLPEPWAMFAAQQCLLDIYQQVIAATPAPHSLGAHLAVRTGAHLTTSSIYYTPDVCGVHVPTSGFLQLPLYTYYAVLAGMREEHDSTGPLLMAGSGISTHVEWLDAHTSADVVFVT